MANNWAIVVGINHYEFLSESPLKFAVADAVAMQTFLCQEAGFAENQVLLCVDGEETGTKKATRSMLRDILRHQIQRARGADNLWFFFSGHGITGDDHHSYLMPIDGNPNDLEDTAISIHFVTDQLRSCKAKNIVLVLDMCRNERPYVGRKNIEFASSLRDLVKHREGHQGIITLFSCGRGEYSYEIADLKQGAFTHALLEGLRQHTILKDLARYLEERVPELHRSAGKVRKQVPLVIPEPDWKVNEPILSNYVTEVDVSQLEKKAIAFELDEDFDEAKQLWRKVIELSPVQSKRSDALKAIDRIDIKISRYAPKPTELSEVPLFKGDLGGSSSPKPIDRSAVEEAIPLAPSKRGNRSGVGSQAIVYPTFKFEYATIDQNCKIQKHSGEAHHFRETINGVDFELVQIPAGGFEMGSNENNYEKPIHHVTVPEFLMGKYPVTQAQWKSIANLKRKNRTLNPDPSHFKGDERPVENVYWEDAVEFCDRLSDHTGRLYRLPSEAEWEYACRAGTTARYQHFGEILHPSLVNFAGKYNETTSVGTFPGNPWGLFDCHGNVWEWCADVWYPNYNDAPTDGSPRITGAHTGYHSGRGGSWADPADKSRAASRDDGTRAFFINNVGFRLALSAVDVSPSPPKYPKTRGD
jgi:formylglycine-generating enzyme required for sulfatase activity/uncharacterized caspase-like protein